LSNRLFLGSIEAEQAKIRSPDGAHVYPIGAFPR